MKVGFHVILFVLFLNLVLGAVSSIGVPGTEYSNVLGGTGDIDDYDERFNATKFMEKVEPEASETYTFVGQVWSALQLAWNAISWVIAGLPILFIGISNQIGDPTAKLAVQTFGAIICSGAYFIIILWLYQALSGRNVD